LPKPAAVVKPPPLTKDAYKAARDRIEQQSRAERKACERFKGNPKDVCEAQARGREKVAKAQLEAQYKPNPETEKLAKFSQADADYDVAKVRCDAMKDKAKDQCLAQAKHDREAAVRLAKVEKVEEVNQLKAKAHEQKHSAQKPPQQPPKS
jgi:hypothetical protein